MSHNRMLKGIVVLIVLALILGGQQTALANTRTIENGEVPFYARIEATDGTWLQRYLSPSGMHPG